jgi:hypothetical protein
LREGRYARGEAHGQARLTAAYVLAIRADYNRGRASMRALAREFGIAPSHIHGLVHGRYWSHLQPTPERVV